MNWGLGFFRSWVVFSILTAIVVSVVSYDHVAKEFRNANFFDDYTKLSMLLLPVDCRQSRGKEGEDYERDPEKDIQAGSRSDSPLMLCWYVEAKLQSLYPEYKDIDAKELSRTLYAKAGKPIPEFRPWREVGELAAKIAGICVGVFLMGASVHWVLAGFAKPRKAN